MTSYRYLIVGGGMTADAAVKGIREVDENGTIGVVCAEKDPPYNRPPLSKGLWKGEEEPSIWRDTNEAGATLHLDTRAVRLDTGARQVRDSNDRSFSYEKLLLATGGAPRTLGSAAERILYFRTRQDYLALRGFAQRGARVAIVGAGFIGSEIAAALAMNDVRVTMFFPEDGICARVFPAGLSQFLVGYYREKGVTVRNEEGVQEVEQDGEQVVLRTSAGETFRFDAVVAGLGIVPEVDLARQAELKIDNGIVVNPALETSHPGIYAAGDVARYHVPALNRTVRVEHEDNANTMGRAAGRSMAGERAPYEHLAFFYSDLFDLGYEAVGDLDARHETVADWKDPNREGVVYYLDAGRVVGVLLLDTWDKVDEARALIAEREVVDRDSLIGRIRS